MNIRMRLHWHRTDLRLEDNRGLAGAAHDSPVLPVFVFDDHVLQHGSPPRIAFMLDALRSLRAAYQAAGSDLLVRRGNPDTTLPAIAASIGADTVSAPTGYSGLARERDKQVADALAADDRAFETVHDAVAVPPGEITTNAGDPYQVFSYYADKWHDRRPATTATMPPDEAFADPTAHGLDPGSLPSITDLGSHEPEADISDGGSAVARDRLETFVAGPIYDYADQRDYPAATATSRLSPHLTFGTIGVRDVLAATDEAAADAPDDAALDSVRAFQEQLAWRDFYTEHLATHPSMTTENIDPFEHDIEWDGDDAAFEAWTAGETGYPIVDAGMRQLRAEAWMHNRVRMIVASFLTKDLRIDWRWGYAWFREKLVDHNTANNAGGWQWAASTGTDAQPFFRIFNPATQCADYDPDGEYVREYVPELRDAPTDAIHEWPELPDEARHNIAPDYPSPVVDHAEAREAALAMYRRARGE